MLNRREFLATTGATGALVATGALGGTASAATAVAAPVGDPAGARLRALGIEHVVVLMLENRSFDHLLHWLPGADGRADMAFPGLDGKVYPNYHLAPDYQGCGYSDVDHSWQGWLTEHNGGTLDAFLHPTWGQQANPATARANTFPLGYYDEADIPVVAALARNYTVLDRYFCSFAGETYPNRFYQHSGATDRDNNGDRSASSPTDLPAIWDQLAAVGTATTAPTGGYFFSDIPFTALWGQTYASYTRPYSGAQSSVAFAGFDNADKVPTSLVNGIVTPSSTVGMGVMAGASFLDLLQQKALPNVCFVDPSFAGEGQGTSSDWHPQGDIRVGDSFVADVYHSLRDAGYLSKTILVINFDEWGGFYDHVEPPRVTDRTDPANPKLAHAATKGPGGETHPDYTQLGFRVPCIVVSDLAPAQVVTTGPYEHASVLRMIESIFGLHPVVPDGSTTNGWGPTRDNFAPNLGDVVTLSAPRRDIPAIPTSNDLRLAGAPASGAAAACTAATKALSVSPAPIGDVATWTAGFGPATRPGAVTAPGDPGTPVPETSAAVAVPLAAAALAGAAVLRRRRDGSPVAPDGDGTGDGPAV